MNAAIERRLLPALFLAQLHRAARRLNRRNIVMAMYHGFTADNLHQGIENHEGKHVARSAFEDHLAFLQRHYHVVPLDDIVRACTIGAPLPDHAAAITIDDGYRSTYTVAYPALKKFNLPATVYLATDFVDNRRFLWTDRVEYAVDHAASDSLDVNVGSDRLTLGLRDRNARVGADRRLRSLLKSLPQESRDQAVDAIERAAGCSVSDAKGGSALYAPLQWSEADEMARSGLISFGSHTHTHVIMSRCEPGRADEELRESRRIIEDRLGRPCNQFCYPNGRRGDFNDSTRTLLKQHGFTSALTTVYGMNQRDADVYTFQRYNLGKPMLRGEVDVRLSGLMDLGSVFRRGAKTQPSV